MLHEHHVIYSVRYYPRFHITAVGLGTYYPWIRTEKTFLCNMSSAKSSNCCCWSRCMNKDYVVWEYNIEDTPQTRILRDIPTMYGCLILQTVPFPHTRGFSLCLDNLNWRCSKCLDVTLPCIALVCYCWRQRLWFTFDSNELFTSRRSICTSSSWTLRNGVFPVWAQNKQVKCHINLKQFKNRVENMSEMNEMKYSLTRNLEGSCTESIWRQWRTGRRFQTPPKFWSFAEAELNFQFRGIYTRNKLIRI
jgi:hypothetical protein